MRVVSPPLNELSRLRQPLTAGEERVLAFFLKSLPEAWEIYIQPHLNGLRPDFVLLHPHVGIAVFEVKDWDLDAMEYFVRRRELWARKDGREFSREVDNPIRKVQLYREEIYNLYCPKLQRKLGVAAITGGTIFPFADTRRLQKLFVDILPHGVADGRRRYFTLAGAQQLEDELVDEVLPTARYSSSKLMRPDLADDLRGWLVEPEVQREQRRPLVMDATQRQLVDSRTTSGYRRLKGPAGSGKSVVLAARAAKLADEGKEVLVVTFNITLINYLRDLTTRAIAIRGSRDNITFLNFHKWCKRVCEDTGLTQSYVDLNWDDPQHVFEVDLPALAMSAASKEGARKYGAVLVDEGQDYRPLWWDTLRHFLQSDGEMLLVADATQDVYGTASAWTDDVMTGAGFRGPWATLATSYRLPPPAIPLIREFASEFLPSEKIDLPSPQQTSLDLSPCRLRWVQTEPERSTVACVEEVVRLMQRTGRELGNADLTYLACDIASGRSVVDELAKRGIKCIETFDEDEGERRRQKVGFFSGDARIKATTIHSFKGWESPVIVIDVRQAKGAETLALIYTGLTRLKQGSGGSRLTVVNACKELMEFGRRWPNQHEA